MKNPRKKDLDLPTRIIHLGLVIFGLLAWGTSEWAGDYEKLKHIDFYVHSWIGMGVSFFVSLRVIYGIIGPKKARFAQWLPYTRDRLQFVWEDIMGLIRLRLPDRQPRQGLASVAEAFGLLVFSVMALTGSLLFFYLEPGIKARGSIHFIKEIHEVGEILLPMFFLLHGGAVILHAVMGRHYWRIMVFLKEQ